MGVEDLAGMDTPQKKGGRPKGSTTKKEKTGREVDGDPYTKDDGDEYWQTVWDLHHSRESDMREVIINTAEYTSCLPRTVVENVHNRDVFSFEELADDPPEWFENHLESLDLKGINSTFVTSPDKTNSNSTSSGLASLIGDDNDEEDDSGFLDGLDDDDEEEEEKSGLSKLLD